MSGLDAAEQADAISGVIDGLKAIAHSIDGLASAVTRVAHGDLNEPGGLEAVSMSINGGRNDDWPSIAGAIREGLQEINASVMELKS